MVLDYYVVGIPVIGDTAKFARDGVVVTAAFATGLGTLIVMRRYLRTTLSKGDRWQFELLGIAIFLVILGIGIIYGRTSSEYVWIFNAIYYPMNNAGKAMLLFMMVSVGYKSFKIRNLESVVLLGSMCLAIMSNVGIGEVLWSGFPQIGLWLDNIPTTGSYRGIMIATAFGGFMLAIRTVLGLEIGYLSGGTEET
jgi:hypothetical protein